MDFHCHLDLYPNAQQVYAETLRRNEFVWLVTTSPRAYVATSRILPATPTIFISPGLHPEVADKKANELELLLSQITACTGVGEVGLDGSVRHRHSFQLQLRVFISIAEACARAGGRVLSVHSRAAEKEVLDVLQATPGFGMAVMHWFSGSLSQLSRAKDLGCWFSVGPTMLETTNGRKLAFQMPRDRIVAESDGPFAKLGGAPVMPWQAGSVARRLADMWGEPKELVSARLEANGVRLTGHLNDLSFYGK